MLGLLLFLGSYEILSMQKLAPASVWTEMILVVALAKLCLIILRHVGFLFQLFDSMGKRTGVFKLAKSGCFPVFAHLGLVLYFK